eukprot:scaffold23817_cov137-Cylindrotheca_fusiformis.AAC.1
MEIHTAVNSIGASPLVVFCNSRGGGKRRKTLALLSLLLQQQEREHELPLSILTDNHGNSVFQGLLNRYQLFCKIPKYSKVHHCASLDDTSTILQKKEQDNCILDDGEDLLDTFWTTVRFLIQAASRPCWTLLQGAAHVAPLLPTEVTRSILRYHCSQEAADGNEEGNNDDTNNRPIPPLHLAVSSYAALHRSENTISHNTQRIWRNQAECFVQGLWATDPLAATTRHPQHGRLPWTQAIASGLSWNSATTTTITKTTIGEDERDDKRFSLLQRLLQAYPPALTEHDPVTGLDPALLAAAASTVPRLPSTVARYRPCFDDTDQLDTIYSLLRLNPTVVRKGE